MDELTSRTATRLFGHEEAEIVLMNGYTSGKLAHGWLITGPRGIGKATLAYRFARTLLSGEPPEDMHAEHPIFRRVAAQSHTDMLVIEPLYDAKKEENARDITVDQARELAQFLSLTPGEGQWRVVIVDSVDALNSNGANAILKILEEPPAQSVILLISHNPGKLLPTIRSRCRQLRLKPLDKDRFISVMRHVSPGIDSQELKALAQLSALSPGVALELHGQGVVEFYGRILAILARIPAINAAEIHAFSDSFAAGKMHTNWQVFTQLVLCLFERVALLASGMDIEAASEEEADVLNTLAALHSAAVWAEKWQQVAEQFMVAERLHLDYKQMVITFFHSITAKEGFQIGSAAA